MLFRSIPAGCPLAMQPDCSITLPYWTATLGLCYRKGPWARVLLTWYLLCQCFGEGSEMGFSGSVHRIVDVRGHGFCPPKLGYCLNRRGEEGGGRVVTISSEQDQERCTPNPNDRGEKGRTLTWKEGYSTGRGFFCTLVMTL